MRIQVKHFMSSPVTTAVGESTVDEIRKLMKRKKIHSVPIIQYAKQLPEAKVTIRGIVTDTDLIKNVDGNTPVEKIMTNKVHVVHKDSSASSAAKMMLKHQVHHMVVMDDGEIVGIVSSLDFAKLVAEHPLD